MARKSNATARRREKIVSTYKQINGKDIKPTWYYGKLVGNGAYFAGTVDNKLICDNNGIPIPYRNIMGDNNAKRI